MRRSLAPSQVKFKPVLPSSAAPSSSAKEGQKRLSSGPGKDDEEMTIHRMPLFGFLEVPESLNKQFKVPSGCVLTKESLELRKIKRLGGNKQFQPVRPGDLASNIFRKPLPLPVAGEEEEEIEEEGLPTQNLPPFEPLVLWRDPQDEENKIEVIPELACKLRPHQREGVQFLFECTMGLRGFDGQGCILADDMGLGKTLMSITAMWTLLNQGFVKGESAVKKVMVVCPTSLVGNWDNEIRKWVGDKCPTFAVKGEPKKMIKNFLAHRGKGVLIVSYETQRLYSKLFENAQKNSHLLSASSNTTTAYNGVCDLLICDEAHKLKNAESGMSISLSALPAKKRVLLSGTPMQNELTEFFNMVNFCNPNVIGTVSEFRKRYERPILAAREPDALPSEVAQAAKLQKELSVIVNEFILKRGNILNAQHLPPKLVQYVCCRLTPLQEALYERLLSSKEIRHIREGKQTNTLNCIRQLINICSHPKLVMDAYRRKIRDKETVDEDLQALAALIPPPSMPNKSTSSSSTSGKTSLVSNNAQRRGLMSSSSSSSVSAEDYVDYSQSGKMTVLYRMMQTMRAVRRGERIVIVSNYTSTLDLIEKLCAQEHWPSLRLDGTVSSTKRTQLVAQFNDPQSDCFAFLLSSKAGGCGINLIGGNRLVLFDPDWNPAADKQAAGRIWREGQKRRCFIYRFASTGSIEEKIIQRQLSKEGLADIVEDKEQVNAFSSDELKQLFTLQKETESEIHDSLQCERCVFLRERQRNRRRGKGHSRENALTVRQREACAQFVDGLRRVITLNMDTVSGASTETENVLPRCVSGPLDKLRSQILSTTEKEKEKESISDEKESENENDKEREKEKEKEKFVSLAAVSRAQRELFTSLDAQLKTAREKLRASERAKSAAAASQAQAGTEEKKEGEAQGEEETEEDREWQSLAARLPLSFSFLAECLRRWAELVPTLLSLTQMEKEPESEGESKKSSVKKDSESTKRESDSDSGNGERASSSDPSSTLCARCVEQLGCPEETDLKRWSHHCDTLSCDDELLSLSLSDDALVSFVFGLSVDFSLLQQREEETREEALRRKEQQKKDLEELNAQRAREREKARRRENGERSESEGEEESEKKEEKEDNKEEKEGEKKAKTKVKAKKEKEKENEGETEIGEKEEREPKKRGRKRKTPLPDVPTESTGASKDSGEQSKEEERTEDAHEDKKRRSAALPESRDRERERDRERDSDTVTSLYREDLLALHKRVSKQRVSLDSFYSLWKALGNINNSWRPVPQPKDSALSSTEEMYTRTPGLKADAESLRRFVEGVDYFRGARSLCLFLATQSVLLGLDDLASKIQSLYAPAVDVEKAEEKGSEERANDVDDCVRTSASVRETESASAGVSETMNKNKSKKGKREKAKSVFDSSDEEDDEDEKEREKEDQQPRQTTQPVKEQAQEANITTRDRESSTPTVRERSSVSRRDHTDSLLAIAAPPSALKKKRHFLADEDDLFEEERANANAKERRVSFEIPPPSPSLTESQHSQSNSVDPSLTQGGEHWNCSMCTLVNSVESIKCEVCGYRRFSSKRKHVDKINAVMLSQCA